MPPRLKRAHADDSALVAGVRASLGAIVVSVPRERRTRRSDRADEWAVTVRLNDGRVLFWCGEEAGRGGQGWGRESQAHRFASLEAAERYAAICATNSKAWEYSAVHLAQPR
jgi:hypothetical protein